DAAISGAANTEPATGPAAAGFAAAGGGFASGGGHKAVFGPAGGTVAQQYPTGQLVVEYQLPDFSTFTEVFDFQHAIGSLSEAFNFEWGPYDIGNMTIVAGDYYDIQLATTFGSLEALSGVADGFDITIGSTLNSKMSDYDLIVIEHDLVEINIIAQHNFSVSDGTDEIVSGLDIQANQAAIFDYTNEGGSQLTMGDAINLASVQQINFAEDAHAAAQFNNAVISKGGGWKKHSDDPSFPSDVDHHDLKSALKTDPEFSALYVSGTYYEVNAVHQASMLATLHSGNTQINAAVINDYEGVAEFQIVAGNTYSQDSIVQTNYLSQTDQLAQFASGDFLPGKMSDVLDVAGAGHPGNQQASINQGHLHGGGQNISQPAINQHAGNQHAGNQHAGNQHAGNQHMGNQHMGNQQFGTNGLSDNLMGDLMAV
ncbi:MAG: hypothetical protein HKN11_15230, partial [Rhizobiales bacterium]|nr:hypothetical protein [Hyphomicrobiales bacterium]